MTPQQAMERARQLAAQHRIRLTGHGRQRGSQRSVQANDIQSALMTATQCEYRQENDTWRFKGGHDLDEDQLDVVLAFEDSEARLVTVI